MKTKNQLLLRSEAARTELQRSTGMDHLSYHLMVLEAGCACLDQTLRPVDATIGREVVEAYRQHLYTQGWWVWFELFWRSFEVRIWAEWSGPESLVPRQSDAWRRAELIKEASTLYFTSYYQHGLDQWLKYLEEKGQLAIPMPKAKHTAPQHQAQ